MIFFDLFGVFLFFYFLMRQKYHYNITNRVLSSLNELKMILILLKQVRTFNLIY
jgi:hypothetical protein